MSERELRIRKGKVDMNVAPPVVGENNLFVQEHLRIKGHATFDLPADGVFARDLAFAMKNYKKTNVKEIFGGVGRFMCPIDCLEGVFATGKDVCIATLTRIGVFTPSHYIPVDSIKTLMSAPGCDEQDLHCDSTLCPGSWKNENLHKIPYSIILNPSSLEMCLRTTQDNIIISGNKGIVFRGDFLHGGMAWKPPNNIVNHHRMFCAVNTIHQEQKESYPLVEDERKCPRNAASYMDIR